MLKKQCWLSSTSTTRKLNVSWKSTTTTKPCFLLQAHIPRRNVGQDSHVAPTPRIISQKDDIMHCTLEAACCLWLGCWSNNVANSHLSPGRFNSSALCSCLVLQCSHLPHWPCHQRRLRIVTACLRPAPADNLHILAGIQPAELRRIGDTFSLAGRAMDPGHLLHSTLTCPLSGNARNLKSKQPILYPLLNNSSVQLTTVTEVQWNA